MTNDPADEIAEFLGKPARDSWLPVPPGADMAGDWQRVQRHVKTAAPTRLSRQTSLNVPWAHRRWMLAGVGVAAIVAGVFSFNYFSRVTNHGLSSDTWSYVTSVGQHGIVHLPDGSRVILGPATTLHAMLPEGRAREMVVDGQVLLTVAHQSPSPFIVRTATSVTRVLGTTLLVREYATDSVAQVVVTEGRVAVGKGKNTDHPTTVLSPGMMGLVSDSGITVASGVATHVITGWTTGELIFEKTPMRKVIADLARSYGVHILLADSMLAKRPITWGVRTDRDRLDQVLRELTTILGAHVIRKHDTLTIVPGRRAPARIDQNSLHPRQELRYGK